MKTVRHPAILSLLFMLLAAGFAIAEKVERKLAAGFHVGYHVGAKSSDFRVALPDGRHILFAEYGIAPTFGGSLSYAFNPWAALEGEFSYTPNQAKMAGLEGDEDFIEEIDLTLLTYKADLLFFLNSGMSKRLFLAFGAGAVTQLFDPLEDGTELEDRTDLLINWGMGATRAITPHLDFRVDMRARMFFLPDESRIPITVHFGLVYRF